MACTTSAATCQGLCVSARMHRPGLCVACPTLQVVGRVGERTHLEFSVALLVLPSRQVHLHYVGILMLQNVGCYMSSIMACMLPHASVQLGCSSYAACCKAP
jgi:hypothetical protein